jgi:hypothetical protein
MLPWKYRKAKEELKVSSQISLTENLMNLAVHQQDLRTLLLQAC